MAAARLAILALFCPALAYAGDESFKTAAAILCEPINTLQQISSHDRCSATTPVKQRVDCQEFQQELNGSGSTESALMGCLEKKPDLLMLGETHFTPNIYELYPKILRDVKEMRPEFDCLFLEANPTRQDLLDDFALCKKSDDECYRPIKAWNLAADRRAETSPNENDPALRVFYEPLAKIAKELKLRVFAIDSRDKQRVSDRNAEMAKNIVTKIKTCKFSAMVVGSNHITVKYYEELPTRRNNTADQLRFSGIKVEGILLKAESKKDPGIKVPGCTKKFEYPSETRGVVHNFKNPIVKELPLSYMSEVELPSLWNQFCGSILIPASK